jgi:hypothetical protein
LEVVRGWDVLSVVVKREARGAGGEWQERDVSVDTEPSANIGPSKPIRVQRLDRHGYSDSGGPKIARAVVKYITAGMTFYDQSHAIFESRNNDLAVTIEPDNIIFTITAGPIDL